MKLDCKQLTGRQGCEYSKGKTVGKVEVQPRTEHEGPEGEQMYSSTLP